MIPPDKLVLLDTNILVDLARGKKAGQMIEGRFKLRERAEKPLISVVTVGEMLALARIFKWGKENLEKLDALFRELVIIDIHMRAVLDRFAEIKAFVKSNGNALHDNDTWIAACTSVADAVLITADKDFDPIHGRFITREYVDPATLL
jgi:tRNA(fMet)-specific endonuclease VapC